MLWVMFLVKFLAVLLQLHLLHSVIGRRRLITFSIQQIIQRVVIVIGGSVACLVLRTASMSSNRASPASLLQMSAAHP